MNMSENCKKIIYGDERYVRDFMYLFDDIKIDIIVDDKKNKFAESWEQLRELDKSNIFVIVCKYDERQANKNLNSIGLIRNKNYTSATTFFRKLDFPIQEIAERKRIYVWGTGERSSLFFKDFVERNPDIEIAGCVDSDIEKKGKTFFQRAIYMPEEVIEEQDIFFVIASTAYYFEIEEYLELHGKKETEDYIHMYAINQWASHMARETIYDIPRVDFLCERPFKFAELGTEGRMTCCCGIPALGHYNVPVYYSEFSKVWHSNAMKVIRLSMINGTYSFCNLLKCSYIFDCGHQEIDTDELSHRCLKKKDELKQIEKKEKLQKNTVFNKDRYKIRELEYPYTLQWSFDISCNLHCPSCRKNVYMPTGKDRKKIDIFAKKLTKNVMPYIKRIKFGGGEPCVSPTYHKFIVDSDNLNIKKVQIISNGSVFTREFFKKLQERYDSIDIMISMDGATKGTAERLRRGINFDKWKENMEFLSSMRMDGKINMLAFSFVVQRDNYREMPDYVRMCLSFHADWIRFSRIMNWGQFATEEFEDISMCDSLGEMKPELAEVVSDDIFKRPEVRLFQWVEWFV